MECCNNCMFYQKGVCVINRIKISFPDIAICDDWELSSIYDVEEFDESFADAFCRKEREEMLNE